MTNPPELVDLGELVTHGWLRPQRPDASGLIASLRAAARDAAAATANEVTFPPWAMAMRYEAALRCARVVVQATGYRIAAERGHVTAIDAADAVTQGRHHRIFVRLHRMRRTRHDFMYETSPDPSTQDLDQAAKDVAALIEIAQAELDQLEPRR